MGSISWVTASIAAWVWGHRRATLGVLAVSVLVALAGIAQLRLSFSSRDFFGTADAGAQAIAELDEFVAQWGDDDATVLVLAQAADVLSAESQDGLRGVGAALRGMKDVSRVVSLADFPGLDPSLATPALVSADRRATVLVVELTTSSDDLAAIVPVMDRVTAVVAQRDGANGLRLTAAGVPAVRAAFFELAIGDQLRLGPLVVLVIAVTLWIAFRRAHAVIVPLAAAGLSLLWLLGAMGWAGEPIGLINQAYFTLLPVIAVADAAHWVQRYAEERARGPDSDAGPQRAVVGAARGVGKACALTSATTAAGFLSLWAADVEILRRFGGWAALGVGLSWVSVTVLMPLALSFTRSPVPTAPHRAAEDIAAWSMRRPWAVVGMTVMLLLGAGAAASTLVVDNRLGDLLPPTHPVRVASDVVDGSLGGILVLHVLPSRDPSGLAQWAEQQPQVNWVQVTEADGRTRVSLHTADVGGRAFTALAQSVRAEDRDATVTGTALVAYTGVNEIATSLRASVLGMLLVVALAVGVAMRSLRLAIVAIPVNAIPLLIGAAALAVLGVTLDPLAAVVVAIALGIAVDDTIHLLCRAAEEGAAGHSREDAMRRAAAHSGHAIVVSTAALALGFGVQMLSSFPPLRLLGGLGAVILLAALLADLALLPVLATRAAVRRSPRQRGAPDGRARR